MANIHLCNNNNILPNDPQFNLNMRTANPMSCIFSIRLWEVTRDATGVLQEFQILLVLLLETRRPLCSTRCLQDCSCWTWIFLPPLMMIVMLEGSDLEFQWGQNIGVIVGWRQIWNWMKAIAIYNQMEAKGQLKLYKCINSNAIRVAIN
jgi:hypothetical protein